MLRRIIHIQESLCTGCGACAQACHEGAIQMIHGVARLVREDYCDGLGNCLPVCPTNAITFEERDVPAFDPQGVKEGQGSPVHCPGSAPQWISSHSPLPPSDSPSQLRQWPIQIQLVPIQAPYFHQAKLLISADCCGYACGSIQHFMKDHVTLIGCPKLDAVDYTQKLTQLFSTQSIQEITVLRMEIPCCGGIQRAVENALAQSHVSIPLQVVTISIHGDPIVSPS